MWPKIYTSGSRTLFGAQVKYPPQVQEPQMVPEVQEHQLLPSVHPLQVLPWHQADHLHPEYFKQNIKINCMTIKGSKIYVCLVIAFKQCRFEFTYRRSSKASRPRRTNLTTVTLQEHRRDGQGEILMLFVSYVISWFKINLLQHYVCFCLRYFNHLSSPPSQQQQFPQ